MWHRQLNSTQSMHVAQEFDTLQPNFAQASCHLVLCVPSIMRCNVCHNVAAFRARGEGKPFIWWCNVCYGRHDHADLPHDTDYPIMCHQCNDLPSTCRIKSVLNPDWLYWCYPCYANHEHHEPIEDITYMDLDSASEDSELDEQEHEAHSVEGSSSFMS